VTRGPRIYAGDRLYFPTADGVAGVQVRELSPLKKIPIDGGVEAMAPTPSGDRVYVVLSRLAKIAIIDRYSESGRGNNRSPWHSYGHSNRPSW
jgi:hypothetical protein